jgi:hypothetical protein
MPQASTSRAQVRYVPESAFGVIPGVGNPFDLRMTGESLDFSIQKERSREIRADRMTTDLVPVGAQAGGGVNFELSYNEYDDLLEAVPQGTWSVYGTAGVGTSFSAAYAANTITAAVAPVGSSAFTTLAQGQWLQIQHPGNANDKKWVKVHASTAPTSTIITLDAATPLTVVGSSAGANLSASRLVNGTTERSFTLEKAFNDINQFFAYRGMNAASLEMGFQSGQIVNGSFGFQGKDSVRAGATQLTGAPVASSAYDIMNAVSGVGQILEAGAALTGTFIKGISLSLNNSLRSRDAIGVLGAASIGSGTIALTGTLEVYLADGTLYDKFVANTASSLSAVVQDAAGNGYVVTLPRLKYGDAKVNAGALDQDAMISLPFEGLRDPSTGKAIIIDRAGVAVT